MIRSEFAANVLLSTSRATASWTQASTCKRARRSVAQRIVSAVVTLAQQNELALSVMLALPVCIAIVRNIIRK